MSVTKTPGFSADLIHHWAQEVKRGCRGVLRRGYKKRYTGIQTNNETSADKKG